MVRGKNLQQIVQIKTQRKRIVPILITPNKGDFNCVLDFDVAIKDVYLLLSC